MVKGRLLPGRPARRPARVDRGARPAVPVPFVGARPPARPAALEPAWPELGRWDGEARRKCPPVRHSRPVRFRSDDGDVVTPRRIHRFLDSQGSPMARYAKHIVRAGVRYEIDPRVIVAIAGVESGYGRQAPGYNAWGWGRARWGSWPGAIEAFSRSVAASYRSLRGGHFERAARSYCGAHCQGRWDVRARSIFHSI